MPKPLKENQKAIRQAKKLLISEGIISESQLASKAVFLYSVSLYCFKRFIQVFNNIVNIFRADR